MEHSLEHNKRSITTLAKLLTEVAALLISNGANSTRTKRNVVRIAEAYGYDVEVFFSFSGIFLSLYDKDGNNTETLVKTIGRYGINFNLISDISVLSWDIAAHKLSYDEVEKRLDEIRNKPHYSVWVKMLWIGIATAALSQLFSGTYLEFLVVFIASVIGFWVRLFLVKKEYNLFMQSLVAAFVSVSVVKMALILGLPEGHAALTACVLWLIPGVPLINGFLDLLEGHIVSGWAKAALGTMIVFMIAVGYYLSVFIFRLFYGV